MDSPKRQKPSIKQVANAVDLVFQKYDENNNGVLDSEEVISLIKKSWVHQGKMRTVST